MKIIEGLEALVGNNFNGEIVCVFDKESSIKEYIVNVLNGKLIFANDDLKKHFVIAMMNQELLSIFFKRI